MGELIRLVSKLRGVGGDVFLEKDVMRSIKTLNPLHAGYELIDVGGGNMVRSVPKGLDADQAVILSTAQEDGGLRVSEAALMSRKAYMGAGTRCPGVPLNIFLLDILCWQDEQDKRHVVSYWMPSTRILGRVAKLKSDVRSSVYYEQIFCIIVAINASYPNVPFPCQNASIYIDPRQLPCAGPACGMIRCRGIYLRSASQSDLVQGL